MIISGQDLAEKIYQGLENEISHCVVKPHLTIITCAPTKATQTYLAYKLAAAKRIGLQTTLLELEANATTEEFIATIERATMQTDSIVVQLPLPETVDTEAVLAAIPPNYDADGFQYPTKQTSFLPPVAGAVAEIARAHNISFLQVKVVVVGNGRLVGQPCATYITELGGDVTVVTEATKDKEQIIKDADILILGTGQPGLITPEQIKPGVVILDAGTAELGGKLRGDADPTCAAVATLLTPVPGGIGPLTIAILLRNCLQASKEADEGFIVK